MKKLLITFLSLLACCGIKAQLLLEEVPCLEGINLLPMYGEVIKCPQQIESDNKFLTFCDQNYDDRQEASEEYRQIGWDYMYKGDLDTAMKRYNQAWLLDKDNPSVYCSFGWLLGKKGETDKAVMFFERAIKMDPDDADFLMFVAVGYSELYDRTNDKTFLNKALELLNKGLELEPGNTSIHEVIKDISN